MSDEDSWNEDANFVEKHGPYDGLAGWIKLSLDHHT